MFCVYTLTSMINLHIHHIYFLVLLSHKNKYDKLTLQRVVILHWGFIEDKDAPLLNKLNK